MTRPTITLRELVRTSVPRHGRTVLFRRRRVGALRSHRCERRGVGSGNLAVVARLV